ncbi:hypothetical protein GH810_13725 [Acetobacterium paludosum]|uniref:Rubrerythrin diiron-binding domain-containing protein n=1 Tax=Acetobacterium paludosum TaxID=52693 RepID=A0A923KQQ1_9FIRM|nr:hypothetical protein [Acetobacterium paludosum]MBC3889369.1 hypothetical protein [Acetobacterium paludosum]
MNLQEYFLELSHVEKLGEDLYEEFSESCSEKLKPVVLAFSQEEAKHQRLMLDLSRDEHIKDEMVNKEIELILNQQIDHIKINGGKLDIHSEKEFFQFALQVEKNSIDIYSAQLSVYEKESNKYKMFKNITKEERKHMLFILDRLYELK